MQYRFFHIVTAGFVTCLIVSNIIAVKAISVGPFFLPVAVIIFPLSSSFGDILTEVYYGYSRGTGQVIWIGFAFNALSGGRHLAQHRLPPALL